VLFDFTVLMFRGKYEEQGKIQAFIRIMIERSVLHFLKLNAKKFNVESIENIENTKGEMSFTFEKDTLDFLRECEDELKNADMPHVVNNVTLIYRQKHEHLSIAELSQLTGNTEGGVKKRLLSARALLAECIENKQKKQDL
jgi:hypothetical protein